MPAPIPFQRRLVSPLLSHSQGVRKQLASTAKPLLTSILSPSRLKGASLTSLEGRVAAELVANVSRWASAEAGEPLRLALSTLVEDEGCPHELPSALLALRLHNQVQPPVPPPLSLFRPHLSSSLPPALLTRSESLKRRNWTGRSLTSSTSQPPRPPPHGPLHSPSCLRASARTPRSSQPSLPLPSPGSMGPGRALSLSFSLPHVLSSCTPPPRPVLQPLGS